MWIANPHEPILCHHDEGKRSADLRHRIDDRALGPFFTGAREQMHQHFRVAAGLKNRALTHESIAQLTRIDEVAVVTDRKLSVHAVDDDRLRVEDSTLARCG